MGEHEEAVADFAELIRREPDRPAAYHLRGMSQLALGRNDEAARDFTEAITRDPKRADALAGRGEALAAAGDFDSAVVDHLEAIRRNPRSAAAHAGFARLWLTWPDPLMHNPALAFDLATRACELSAWDDPDCLGVYAMAKAAMGEA
jgi:serine/threonine-protein kinase